MKWTKDSRKCVGLDTRNAPDDSMVDLVLKPITIHHGKPTVTRTHIRDAFAEDDNGNKSVVASTTFKAGEVIFPAAYIHPTKKIVGETKDARYDEKRGEWVIYIDSVLRDKTGQPVMIDGQKVDMSGWFFESELRDAGLGSELIRPGQSAPSINEIEASRNARIRRQRL